MILNKEQEAAANAMDGTYVVVAGPGSGKTTVMIERYMRMLSQGINMNDILNLTFTNAAATELVKRTGLTDADKIFRTFHSLCIEILKKERDHLPFKLGPTVIPVSMEDYKLLFDLVRQFPAINNFRTLRDKISRWKCENVGPDEAMEQSINNGVEYFFALAYGEYENKQRNQGWLDFDNCIKETVKLFEENEEVKARWQKKYISIDECQDTDATQFRLLQLLFKESIFAVGDENQLIYEWRSAQSGNLTNFQQKFPGATTLYLGQNYRSTGRLVSFFKEIIPVDNGIASHMITENEEGVPPVITEYQDDVQEAHQVLAKITDPVNTVIIARTNRQLFIFQRICVNQSIKYKILGKKDFFETNEVKKLLALAKESNDPRPANIVLTDIVQRHNLLQIYRNTGNMDESDPIENINSIVKMAAGKGTIKEFLDRLRKLTHARKNAKGLTLSTVHQMKGRQAKHIFLVGCNQDKIPHKNGELSEERRILFVGCSRAAETLNISYYGQMSMFLNDYEDQVQVYESEVLNAEI